MRSKINAENNAQKQPAEPLFKKRTKISMQLFAKSTDHKVVPSFAKSQPVLIYAAN